MEHTQRTTRKISDERQKEIVDALESKGVKIRPCVKCNGNSHRMLDAVSKVGLLFGGNEGGNFALHHIIITCQNCGYMSEYSKQELGLYDPR